MTIASIRPEPGEVRRVGIGDSPATDRIHRDPWNCLSQVITRTDRWIARATVRYRRAPPPEKGDPVIALLSSPGWPGILDIHSWGDDRIRV